MSIQHNARDAFNDRFGYLLDSEGVLTDEGRDNLPQYWQDDIYELADDLVPVYNYEVVDEWQDAGMPEVEEVELIGEGVIDIIKIMQVALYEQYSAALYEMADRAGFND